MRGLRQGRRRRGSQHHAGYDVALILNAYPISYVDDLQDDVAALRKEMARLVQDLAVQKAEAAASTATLAALDRVKTRMEAACSTLKVCCAAKTNLSSCFVSECKGQRLWLQPNGNAGDAGLNCAWQLHVAR